MPVKEAIDVQTRLRIVAYLRMEMEKLGLTTAAAMARHLGVSASTVSRPLAGQLRVGLDLVLAMNRKLHISADRLLNIDPPQRYFNGQASGQGSSR